jgi:hypothetical protein
LSEQAKVALIQEGIKEAKSSERTGFVLLMVGALLTGGGSAALKLSQDAWYAVILGVVSAVFGFCYGAYHARKEGKLREQLKTMATDIQTCPKCCKEISQGKFAFCPFCDSPLTPPTLPK